MSWFRIHTHLLHNAKAQALPAPLFKAWINLLCLAKEGDGVIPGILQIAFHLRMKVLQAKRIMEQLEQAGFIAAQTDGTFIPNDWDEHQYTEEYLDSEQTQEKKRRQNADRQQRYRDRHITQSGALRNALSNVSNVTPESDTESDTESEAESVTPLRVTPLAPTPIKTIPPDAEQRIRRIADDAPDPQDYEIGVRLAVQELVSSVNPAKTLTAMEQAIPLWWSAMREGRARIKPLRFVITDRDYLRKPREPTQTLSAKQLAAQQREGEFERLV